MTDDTISRQDAINLALEFFVEFLGGAFYENGQKELIARFQRLPPAQPVRKKGKWIDYSDEGFVECPFCHSATNCDGNKDELHFCFSCGADMRTKETDCDYERAVEQLEHDMLYEPTFNQDDGNM